MDRSALAELKKLLDSPEPLEVLAAGVKNLGEWRAWTFERQVWYLRKRNHMSQREHSLRCGVSQHRISRIEAGADLKLGTLRALWRPLGYEPLIIPDAADFPRHPRP